MILEALFLAGSGFFLYKDSKNGFIKSRMLVEKVSGGRICLLPQSQNQKRVKNAVNAVEENKKIVARLRESVATVEANMKVHYQVANDQKLVAAQYHELLEQAINKNDKPAEIAAASGKVNALQRAEMNERLAQAEEASLPDLRQQLDEEELNLSLSEDEAETVRATSNFAEGLNELYLLNSDIHPQTGSTARGELSKAVIDSQREVYKAQALLGMAKRSPRNNGGRRLLIASQIHQEIESARQKMALLPDQTIPVEAVE